MNFVIAIICSLLLHLIVLFAVLPDQKKDNQANAPENVISAELLPPETESATEDKKQQTIRMLKGDIYYKDDTTPTLDEVDAEICNGKSDTYVGAGIIIQPGSDLVTSAPPQYPAYKAGIRVGDKLIDPFGSDVMPDGYIDFTVLRNNELIKFHIKAEKICYKNKG